MEITLKKSIAWVFGILFILGGIGMMVDSILAGVITLLVGLFIIPNVRQEISDRYDIEFSTWMVVIIAVVGLGIAGAMLPPSDVESQGDENTPETPGK